GATAGATGATATASPPPPTAPPAGAPARPPAGKLAVRCAGCHQATVVGPVHLARLLLPSLWLPRRGYNRLMRCPACHRTAWCALDWSGFNPLR
ncbi:MAG TPA: hypothetical protein VKU91_07765, partial [Acidimicrobiales bacterium]|nr:hypothetical protein [Acidimicrobiales bacterium]